MEPSHGCWEIEGPNKARDVCRGGLVRLLSWGDSDGGWSNKSSDSSDDEGSVTVDVENDNDDDGPDNRVGVRVQELDDDLNVQTEGVELSGPPQTVEEEDQESAMQESDSEYGRDPTCIFKTDTREGNQKCPRTAPEIQQSTSCQKNAIHSLTQQIIRGDLGYWLAYVALRPHVSSRTISYRQYVPAHSRPQLRASLVGALSA